MQIWRSNLTLTDKVNERKHSISVSSLLNEVSIEPLKKETDFITFTHPNSTSSSPSMSTDSHIWQHSGIKHRQIILATFTKAKRKRILPHQYKRLMDTFQQTDTPSSETRSQLAEELDMTKREVQVWFQNRRAKANRIKINQQDNQYIKNNNLSLAQEKLDNKRHAAGFAHPYHYNSIRSITPRKSLYNL